MFQRLCLFATLLLATGLCLAQSYSESRLYPGTVLVAKEKLGDPNFSRTVVLIVRRDEDEGTLGVVINRPSEVTLAKAFPDIPHASSDPIYEGGPVSPNAAQALLRSSIKVSSAERILPELYVVTEKALLEKSIASRLARSKFHVYSGYAGWAPGQLESEIRLGAWVVLAGSAKYVFDSDPESLWQRLNNDANSQIASALRLRPATLR